MNKGGGSGGEMGSSAPTGCYKCGRPGHWARDCPNSYSSSNPSDQNPINTSSSSFPNSNPNSSSTFASEKQQPKPKKTPKARPKLTPDFLLSDDGIGYVLRHFPRVFNSKGSRGHEASDLGKLIGLYADWHSHLIPYYSFDQFVHKVEQVGATRRVRLCLGGLREKVANGQDPTKAHEPPVEEDYSNKPEANHFSFAEVMDVEETGPVNEEVFGQNLDTDALQEDMLQEEPFPSELEVTGNSNSCSTGNNASSISREKQISDEQKARMEANRLKALERAAARARSSQAA